MTTARYQRFAGPNGNPRDYTEFPAQLMEHYAFAPEVLPQYAKHYKTGEVIPEALLKNCKPQAPTTMGLRLQNLLPLHYWIWLGIRLAQKKHQN